MTKPKYMIATVMPTYNNDKFIREALDSILTQTYDKFHLIIVNDGSTDNTPKILEEYESKYKDSVYPKVTILHHDKNYGTGVALNTGFQYEKETTNTPYELWSASDNTYDKNMFMVLKNELDDENIDYIYANTIIRVMDDTGLKELYRKNLKDEVDQTWNPIKFLSNYNLGISWMWKKEIREEAGKYFMTGPCEDYDMVSRMVFNNARFKFIDVALAYFRRHNANMSSKVRKTRYAENLVEEINRIKNAGECKEYIAYSKWKYRPQYREERKDITFEMYKKKFVKKIEKKEEEIVITPCVIETTESIPIVNETPLVFNDPDKKEFTEIYEKNKWHGKESKSGTGSDLEGARRMINKLPNLIAKYHIKSVVDIACGDLNWMKEVFKIVNNFEYTGVDIVHDLIEKNKENFPRHTFIEMNVLTGTFDFNADLIICRDFLVHISFTNILSFLLKVSRSKCKYILLTDFNRGDRRNQDDINPNKGITWRPINLCYPFAGQHCLPAPLESINERCVERDLKGSYEDKRMVLYKVEDIAKALNVIKINGNQIDLSKKKI